MAANSPAPGAAEGSPNAIQEDDRQERPATPSKTFLSSASDDNPRSPKRRRISPPEDVQNSGDASGLASSADSSDPVNATEAKVEETTTKPETKDNSVPPGQNQQQQQNPAVAVRLENLGVLDAAAHRILAFLARLTPADALGLSRAPDSPSSREYAALRSHFEYTRRFYNTGAHFLSPKDLGLGEKAQVEVLRKANQAIFASSVFTGEIGLRDMDRSFLSVFVPEGGKLLKPQGSMYLELKTQGFITAWRTGAAPPAIVMSDMFGHDIDKAILSRRPGTNVLALSEQDFLNRLTSRRDILQSHIKNNTLNQLPEKYKWEDFSREVSAYLSKTIENSPLSLDSTTGVTGTETSRPLPQQGQLEGQFSVQSAPFPVGQDPFPSLPTTISASALPFQDDFVAQAARAAEIAMQGTGPLSFAEHAPPATSTPPANQGAIPGVQQTTQEYQQYDPTTERVTARSPMEGSSTTPNEIPHVSQTAPTSVLYERARLAATTKALAARKGMTPSQRRPWTTEEENTLMAGLDRVKGPHWSQILAMYGPGGTINEALKDRNQVQLKDKARNLKLFFLKSGIEVPYYLKYVTGDLKTRAPGHPNKQESRDQDLGQGFGLDDADEGLATGSNGSRSGRQSPVADDTEEFNPTIENKKPFEPSMDDVEAMIARAAAQASQSIASGWP